MLVARRLRTALALALALTLTLTAVAAAQTKRVKNGQDAADGEYPWTVALVSAGEEAFAGQFCGGTLLAPTVVVTAAHCVTDVTAEEVTVVAGVTKLSAADGFPADTYFDVASIALHPLEDVEEYAIRYDAAVLRLATPVDPSVTPSIPLAPPGATAPSAYAVSGWGLFSSTVPKYPDRLQVGEIDPVPDADCAAAWEDSFHAEDMVCALRVAGPTVTDACGGDSGGPLVDLPADPLSPAGVELYGAVSYGSTSCEEADVPGVYTRLTAPAIHAWVSSALDGDVGNDPVIKPRYVGGAPFVTDTTKVDQTVSCTPGSFAFASDDPRQPATTTELLVRRVDGSDLVTVDLGSHRLTAADTGHQFLCEARGRVAGGGGYAMARSSRTAAVTYVPPAQPQPQQPQPVPQVPVTPVAPALTPTPTPSPTPTPVPRDTSRPTVTTVSRRCTRKRSCTFTISAKDGTGPVVAGVTAVQATLTSITTRTCRRGGKRVRCARTTTRTLHPRKRADGRFTLALSKLAKGRHTISLQAIDGAGNLQRTAYRLRFTLR